MSIDNFKIRSLCVDDLDAVQAIEQQSYPHPWTAAQFVQEIENPVSTVNLLWVGERLAGYICYWLIAGELQVLNVATAGDFRRQGVAGLLLENTIDNCLGHGLEKAWLEVRASNSGAINLYRQHGFVADVIRSRYYRDGEDALMMVCDFTDTLPAGKTL